MRAKENQKKRGKPDKIYHMRNITSRQNLITCELTNELTHALLSKIIIFLWHRKSFMVDRMGLDGTMLHYLAVQQAMMSAHRPIHFT